MLSNGDLFKGLGTRERKLLLTKLILEHKPFNLVFENAMNNDGVFNITRTVNILRYNNFLSEYSIKTLRRRSSTVNAWLRSIFSFIDDY